jgi:hypothetical protein
MPSDDLSQTLIDNLEKLYPSGRKPEPQVDEGLSIEDIFVDDPAPGIQSINPAGSYIVSQNGMGYITTGGSGGGSGGSIIITSQSASAPTGIFTTVTPNNQGPLSLDEGGVLVRKNWNYPSSPAASGNADVPLRTYLDELVIDETKLSKIKCTDGCHRSLDEWFSWKLRQQMPWYIKREAFHAPP